VVIVDDPDKGVVEGNLAFRDGKSRCKHLLGDVGGKYECAVHNRPWYEETPCFAHGQVEKSEDEPCRVGQFIMSKLNGVVKEGE
jgi:hypothetical protein